MDDKLINFHIYRYHLLPLETANQQINLFKDKKMTIKEIKERKNEFFEKVLKELVASDNSSHPLKLEHNEDQNYLFKLAQKKTTIITKDFQNIEIPDAPYVHVIFNNDPSIQKIAISDNKEAFSNPEVVKNILKKLFRKDLEKFGLNIEIEALYDKVEFWKYVSKHRKQITFLNFEFIKPNLANISKSLPQVFKNFADNTNSHESHITIKAPENGTLANIDKSNEAIKGLVDYTSEGAGSIKLKIKGVRKQISTKEKPVTLQIREIDIEGPAEQVIKLYKTIVE